MSPLHSCLFCVAQNFVVFTLEDTEDLCGLFVGDTDFSLHGN